MSTSVSHPKWTQRSIEARVSELGAWFQNLDLQGVATAPDHFLGDYPRVKWDDLKSSLAQDLSGMTVLDIGCNAGFYSFALKARGADRVVGIDWDKTYLDQARFAAEVLDLDVEFKQLSIWQIGALREKFDLVLFMGVFYHLRHPLLALDLIHEHVAKDRLLFQSMQRGSDATGQVAVDYAFAETKLFDDPTYPKLHFVEHAYCGDTTNWWLPNRSCVEAMLRSAGFVVEEQPADDMYLCRRRELQTAPDGPHAVYPARD